MPNDAKPMNIYQKLAEIRKQVEVIRKDRRGYGYTYAAEEEILSKITPSMKKLGLSLIPAVTPGTLEVTPYSYKKTKSTQKGEIYEENANEVLIRADMTWTWVNNDDPDERVVVPWALVGQQGDASQAFGSALTYASRYFLLKYFNVATTDDDPDAFRSKQKAAEAAEDKLVADEIVRDFDLTVKSYLGAHPDKTEEVKKFISGDVKGGNYFAISQSILASKLSADFRAKFTEAADKETAAPPRQPRRQQQGKE